MFVGSQITAVLLCVTALACALLPLYDIPLAHAEGLAPPARAAIDDQTRRARPMQRGPGVMVFANGGEVVVEIRHSTAYFTSEIYLHEPGPPRYLGRNREETKIINLGVFPAGTELVFSIKVLDTGEVFFTGPSERNSDGRPHAYVNHFAPGRYSVGFEDHRGEGDSDFDDVVFHVLMSEPTAEDAPMPASPVPALPATGHVRVLLPMIFKPFS